MNIRRSALVVSAILVLFLGSSFAQTPAALDTSQIIPKINEYMAFGRDR